MQNNLNATPNWTESERISVRISPELAKERRELIEQVGTSDYRQILTQKHGIRAAARWMIKLGRLDQFSLAQEQLARSKLPLGLDKETKNKKKGKEKRGSKKKA